MMKRFLSLTALALIMGAVPALAADTSTTPPVQHGVSTDASNAAKMPPAGSPDQSGGAAEQSSAPPSSAAGSQSSNAGASLDPDSADIGKFKLPEGFHIAKFADGLIREIRS